MGPCETSEASEPPSPADGTVSLLGCLTLQRARRWRWPNRHRDEVRPREAPSLLPCLARIRLRPSGRLFPYHPGVGMVVPVWCGEGWGQAVERNRASSETTWVVDSRAFSARGIGCLCCDAEPRERYHPDCGARRGAGCHRWDTACRAPSGRWTAKAKLAPPAMEPPMAPEPP